MALAFWEFINVALQATLLYHTITIAFNNV
jgi:hypothetical protein